MNHGKASAKISRKIFQDIMKVIFTMTVIFFNWKKNLRSSTCQLITIFQAEVSRKRFTKFKLPQSMSFSNQKIFIDKNQKCMEWYWLGWLSLLSTRSQNCQICQRADFYFYCRKRFSNEMCKTAWNSGLGLIAQQNESVG